MMEAIGGNVCCLDGKRADLSLRLNLVQIPSFFSEKNICQATQDEPVSSSQGRSSCWEKSMFCPPRQDKKKGT